MRKTFGLLLALGLVPAALWALDITSVSPTTVAVDSAVTVTGGPFSQEVAVFLGDRRIEPRILGERQLVFTVPPLPEGEYSLLLKDQQGSSVKTYTLRVIEPPPRIASLSPANIDICSNPGERRVTVEGVHFLPGASLLLDGAAVPYARVDDWRLTFSVPALESGIYPVQVVNPGGASSLPHSLWINDVPEIDDVRQGEDFVNFYQVIIQGKNFFYNSTLVINEYPAGFFDLPPQQRIIPPQGGQGGPRGNPVRGQADNLYYADCHTLIYNRFPVSAQPRQISLQVINPDGKRTESYQATLP